jgi:hypothetical protein
MPRIIQLQNPDLSGWQRIPSQTPALPTVVHGNNPDIEAQNIPSRSPYMRAAMPVQASTSDAFIRQLYGGPNVPTYRILPGKGTGR